MNSSECVNKDREGREMQGNARDGDEEGAHGCASFCFLHARHVLPLSVEIS